MNFNYLSVGLMLVAAAVGGQGSARRSREVKILSKTTAKEDHQIKRDNATEMTIAGDPKEIQAIFSFLSASVKNQKNSYPGKWQVRKRPKTYDVVTIEMSWHEALIYCKERRGNLATILSQDSMDRITVPAKLVANSSSAPWYYWIGGTRLGSSGGYYWFSDGHTFSFSDWVDGYPTSDAGARCMQLYYGGQEWGWINVDCSIKRYPICEYGFLIDNLVLSQENGLTDLITHKPKTYEVITIETPTKISLIRWSNEFDKKFCKNRLEGSEKGKSYQILRPVVLWLSVCAYVIAMNSNCLGVCILLLAITTRGRAGSEKHLRNVSIVTRSSVKETHQSQRENFNELVITGDGWELEAISSCLQASCSNVKHYTKTVCEQETMKLNCLPGQSIKIIDVFYGRNTEEICTLDPNQPANLNCPSPPHSKEEVEKRCNFKQICSVWAHNNVFTDPCLNTFKYLRVSYMCLEDPLRTVTACDIDAVKISCPQGETIKVNSAQYGRIRPSVCNRKGDKITTLTCQVDPQKVTDIATNRCDGKPSCEVQIMRDVVNNLGDPCFGVFKHLDVNYMCI